MKYNNNNNDKINNNEENNNNERKPMKMKEKNINIISKWKQ